MSVQEASELTLLSWLPAASQMYHLMQMADQLRALKSVTAVLQEFRAAMCCWIMWSPAELVPWAGMSVLQLGMLCTI